MPIRTFKSKALKKFWEKNETLSLPAAHVEKLSMILDIIDGAEKTTDLKPFFGFHGYRGGGKGIFSFDVSGNFRVLFRFVSGEAFDLWYGDPHGRKVENIMGKK